MAVSIRINIGFENWCPLLPSCSRTVPRLQEKKKHLYILQPPSIYHKHDTQYHDSRFVKHHFERLKKNISNQSGNQNSIMKLIFVQPISCPKNCSYS